MTLPGRLRADEQGDTAIAIARERCGFRAVVAAGLDVSGNADAAQAAGALRLCRALVEAIPVRELLRACKRAGEITRVVDLPRRGLVRQGLRLDQVLPADRVRCNAEVVRGGVDRTFDEIRRLRPPG